MTRTHAHSASTASGAVSIPEVDTDPVSPAAEDAWVLRTGGGTDGTVGEPRGMLLALTYSGDITAGTYQFSYRTAASTTVRVTLS
ncbi:MAG: hypothetical protein AAB895_04335 [Patescibacteria group bacterium]